MMTVAAKFKNKHEYKSAGKFSAPLTQTTTGNTLAHEPVSGTPRKTELHENYSERILSYRSTVVIAYSFRRLY
jgi:hypothetical protein